MIIKQYTKPVKGDIKFKKRFAILPKKISNNGKITIILWQVYYKKYHYTTKFYVRNFGGRTVTDWFFVGECLNKMEG